MSKDKKVFKVVWHEFDVFENEMVREVRFIAGEDEFDILSKLTVTDVSVREATADEAEAYVVGYEDGFDNATAAIRLADFNEDEAISFEDLVKELGINLDEEEDK